METKFMSVVTQLIRELVTHYDLFEATVENTVDASADITDIATVDLHLKLQ